MELQPETKRQIGFFIKNRIPIREYGNEVSILTKDFIQIKELRQTTVKMNEIDSLEAPRLWIKNKTEERRKPYDIFQCSIPMTKCNILPLCIQEKWIKRTDIKIIGDAKTIEMINEMKYEIEPDIYTNIETSDRIDLKKMINQEYQNWQLYNKHFHGLQKIAEKMEAKADYFHEEKIKKGMELSTLESIMIKSMDIEFPYNFDTKAIAAKYGITFNAVWYKYYEQRENDLLKSMKKYTDALKILGE